MNHQQAALMNSGLMQNQMAAAAAAAAAGQMPEGLTEAEKRNFAATRQAMFNRNPMMRAGVAQGGVAGTQAQLQQFQAQQMFQQQQQQQRQLQAQALQQAQAAQAQPGQMVQTPQQKLQQQQQPQQQMNRNQPQQLPNQPRQISVTPGHTPQMAPGQPSNHGSPIPPHQAAVNAQHLQPPHRNSPAVEGEVPSHSPTPQTGSPNKRQRLSPAEGGYPQQMNGQPMMAMGNGGIHFTSQFQPGMIPVKQGMVPQMNRFPNMTPQQVMAMHNKQVGNKMPGQQTVLTPGGTQMQPNSALQDYQNQLMQLERVNQQRLTEGGSQPNGPPQRTPSNGAQGFKGRPSTAGSPAASELGRRDSNKGVSPHSDVHAPQQQQFNGQMPGPNNGMWQQQVQSPHLGQRRSPSQPIPPGQSPMNPPAHPMPPPNGPVANVQNSGGKTQPNSPSNPPTPTKTHKQLPGKAGKKDAVSPKRRGNGKKTPATPVATSEPPTPTTPATPHAGANPVNGQQAAQPQGSTLSATTPNSSNSKVSTSTNSSTPNGKEDPNSMKPGALQNNPGDVEMGETLLFPPQGQPGGPGQLNGMHGQPNMVGGHMQGGGHLEDPNFLADFGNGENDVGELDFDFGTFLNEEDTTSGMGFDSGFNWNEGVETGHDM